jgi:hypothetical protein
LFAFQGMTAITGAAPPFVLLLAPVPDLGLLPPKVTLRG